MHLITLPAGEHGERSARARLPDADKEPGALFDVLVSVGKGQGNALRDADVCHLEGHALRGAQRDGILVPLLIQLQRGVPPAEVGIDVVAAVPRAKLQRLVRERDGLIAHVHRHPSNPFGGLFGSSRYPPRTTGVRATVARRVPTEPRQPPVGGAGGVHSPVHSRVVELRPPR